MWAEEAPPSPAGAAARSKTFWCIIRLLRYETRTASSETAGTTRTRSSKALR